MRRPESHVDKGFLSLTKTNLDQSEIDTQKPHPLQEHLRSTMNTLRNTFLRSTRHLVRTNATLAGKPSAVPVR
jgi:hypothetical protein